MIILQTRTRNIFTKEYIKWLAKKIIKKNDGPKAVQDSIFRGLDELKIEYKINSKPNKGDILIVLAGKQALRDSIKLKNDSIISTLIAGPNICVSPLGDNRMICNDSIDKVLVPSKWVRDLWINLAPEINKKIIVWAAGVSIKKSSTRNSSPIIYNKLKSNVELNKIEEALKEIGYNPIIFNYGSFKQDAFFDALNNSPFLIYLSKSESQGLAIQEAWARNVPTLVLKSDGYNGDGLHFEDDRINAPYLNDELGYFFNNEDELKEIIPNLEKLNPINYCKTNLSDIVCAKNLINLIK